MKDSVDIIHQGDALEVLRRLPDQFVNCIVTSPPYYGLRDYGVDGQIGLEETPQAWLARLTAVFTEARRVLRDDGVLWCNIGDSYGANYRWGGATNQDSKQWSNGDSRDFQKPTQRHAGDKNLLGQPWRLAFALQDSGWILRSDCIWAKRSPMPESVRDRPTKSHEYVFLFAKKPRYWYDQDATREPTGSEMSIKEYTVKTEPGATWKSGGIGQYAAAFKKDGGQSHPAGRNLRDVFWLASEPNSFAHFATFPQRLIEPLIKAGCPEKVCEKCGKPWVREVEASGGTIGKSWHDHSDDLRAEMSQAKKLLFDGYKRQTIGFSPTCTCSAPTRPGIVLDPFMGSGTTALVARRLGRSYVGIELNAEYVALAEERLAQSDPMQPTKHENGNIQLSLFGDI